VIAVLLVMVHDHDQHSTAITTLQQ